MTTVGRFGLQLLAQVVLARMLGPDIYGVFGMGLVVFNFINFLASFGFAWSLSRLKDVADEDIRYAFTWQALMGTGGAIALYAFAPWVADYFRDPRVQDIVRWMALASLINAVGAVSGHLMRRQLNFRASGLIQFGSYAAGYIFVGLPMAFMGAGVNALVAAWMVQALVAAIAGYWVCPHPVKPLLVGPQSREMLKVGAAVFFTNLANWAVSNLDRMVLGRYLNAQSMGLYTAGYNLANMPNSLLLGALQPVFMATGVQVQDELGRLRNAYVQVLATIWVLLLPMFVALAWMSPDIVALLYGAAWHEAGPVLAILFLGMPGFVTWGMSTPILWNTGRAHHEVLLQLPQLPIVALAFYWVASHGVNAIAAVASGVLVLRGAVVAVAAFKVLSLRGQVFVQSLTRGLVLSGAVSLVLVGVMWLLPSGWPALLRVMLEGVAALSVGLLMVGLMPSVLGPDAAAMIVRFVPRLKSYLLKAEDRGTIA